jgi:hypothetical protein
MNVVAKTCLALLAAAALGRPARAADPAVAPAADPAVASPVDMLAESATAPAGSDRPYATIPARNIIALTPIPIPDPNAELLAKDPPPKITANGITLIFGVTNVLFKVSTPAKAGQAGGDKSYMLSEGQMEDDIEVVKIDVDAAVITFKNHDIVEDIPLVGSQGSGGGAGQGAGPRSTFAPTSPAAAAAARRAAALNQSIPVPTSPAASHPLTTAANNNNNNSAGSTLNNLLAGGSAPASFPVGTSANPIQPNQIPPDLTPEQAAILIEAERAHLQTMDNPPYSPNLLPPTSLGQRLQSQQQNEGPPEPP